MQISMILAMDKNGLIGKDNGLPWHHKEDMKWFRAQTSGKAILMGRKTFESIGKPLPYRLNIVLSSTPIDDPNVYVVKSLEEAIKLTEESAYLELVIIGGKQVYESFLDRTDLIFLTIIDEEYEGDSYITNPFFLGVSAAHEMFGDGVYRLSDEEGEIKETWGYALVDKVKSGHIETGYVDLKFFTLVRSK